MKNPAAPTTLLLKALLLLCVVPAFGDDGLTIILNNNTTTNIRVTVYDRAARPAQKILSNQTINGFASMTVMVSADDSGLGHISWTATTVDEDMRQCAHRDKPHLSDHATVQVYANRECSGAN